MITARRSKISGRLGMRWVGRCKGRGLSKKGIDSPGSKGEKFNTIGA